MLVGLRVWLDLNFCGDGELTRQSRVGKQICKTSGREERLGLGGHRNGSDDILEATNVQRGRIFGIQELFRAGNLLLQSVNLGIDAAGRSRWVGVS